MGWGRDGLSQGSIGVGFACGIYGLRYGFVEVEIDWGGDGLGYGWVGLGVC